jgi:hypothetical protein
MRKRAFISTRNPTKHGNPLRSAPPLPVSPAVAPSAPARSLADEAKERADWEGMPPKPSSQS